MNPGHPPQRTGAEWLELLLDDLCAAARERAAGRQPVAAVLMLLVQDGPNQQIATLAEGPVVSHSLDQIGLMRIDTAAVPAAMVARELLTYAALEYARADEAGERRPMRGEVN